MKQDVLYAELPLSVVNKGSYDLEAHISTAKHKKQSRIVIIPQRPANFLLNKIKKKTEEHIIAAEEASSFHAVKNHLLYRYMDCTLN
jgi:hypothetical protein